VREAVVENAITGWLADRNYLVLRRNFCICTINKIPDITAFKWSDKESISAISIECKGYGERAAVMPEEERTLSCIRAALAQAMLYRTTFPVVYVGVPGNPDKVSINDLRRFLEETGVGVLMVDEEKRVHEVLTPTPVRPFCEDFYRNMLYRAIPLLAFRDVFRDEFRRGKVRYSALKYGGAWCAEDKKIQYGAFYYPSRGEFVYFGVNAEYKSGIAAYLSKNFDPSALWKCVEKARDKLHASLGIREIGLLAWCFTWAGRVRKEEFLEDVSKDDISGPDDLRGAVQRLRKHALSVSAEAGSPGEIYIATRVWNLKKGVDRDEIVSRFKCAIEAFKPVYEYLSRLASRRGSSPGA